MRLEWEPVPGAATFLVEAGSAPAPALDNLARFNTGNAATVLQVLDVPGGTYYVRVRGVGPDGLPGPASNEITVRVGACAAAPGPPTGFSAQVSGNQVTLSRIPPAGGNGVSSYIVEAGSSTGASDLTAGDTGSVATSYDATAVGPGTYFVRVRARTACGASAPSNEVTVVAR